MGSESSRKTPGDAIRKAFEGPESKGPKNPWPKKGVQPVTGMGVAGSVIRIEGGLPENSDSISNIWTLRMNWGLCSGAEREFPNIDILKPPQRRKKTFLGI